MHVEFGGRYAAVATDASPSDQKIMRGLAEIHLLDKELAALNKRHIRIRNGAFTGDGDALPSARSVYSKADGTFLTREKQSSTQGSVLDEDNAAEEEDEVAETEADADDAGEEGAEEGEDGVEALTEGSPTVRSKAESSRTGKSSRARRQGSHAPSASASASTSARRPAERRPPSAPLEPRNLHGLTQRDEMHLRLLLDADDDEVPEPFGGLGDADRHRLAEIDRQLAAFQASDPLFASRSSLRPPDGVALVYDMGGDVPGGPGGGDDTDPDLTDGTLPAEEEAGRAKAAVAAKGDPVVAAQRAHRAHRRYVDDLERRLLACRAKDFDYSGLLADDVDDGNDGDDGEEDIAGRASSPSAARRRGAADTTDASPAGESRDSGALGRAISMRDIHRILSTLKGSLSLQVRPLYTITRPLPKPYLAPI
jgi:hypothetical protein